MLLFSLFLNIYFFHFLCSLNLKCVVGDAIISVSATLRFDFAFSWQIVLLTLENQYIQHLAGNVLSFISEFVATSVCYNILF